MKDELIASIAHDANLEADTAALVVQAMMRYITANFPSSVVGELHELLEPSRE